MVQPLEIKNQRCFWRGIGSDAVYPKAKAAQTSFYPQKIRRIGALKVDMKVKVHMKKTFRNVLVATVATSLLLTACGSSETERQQPKVNTGNLRAPMNNPTFDAGAAAQQQEPQMAVMDVSTPGGQADKYARAEMGAQAQPAAQEQQGGLFDWMWKDKPQQQQQVNTMERRVPVQNQNPSADFADAGMGSYEAAAPIAEVDMAADMDMQADMNAPQMAPQSDIVVAEEVIMMDDTFTPVEETAQPQMQAQAEGEYPSLASVPPRPERVDAINEADARMADLEAARAESYAQNDSLNAQMGADAEGSMLASAEPQPVAPAANSAADVDAEFAALIGADAGALPASGEPVVVMEEQPAVVVSQESEMYQEPAPIEMASTNMPAQAMNAPAEDTNWEPAPLAPQTQPVQEGEWVSLQQDPQAQMAVPVEQVEVVGTPQVAAVSAVPVVPQDDSVGGIQLTPPSAFGNTVRTLPESRYAARRQAVYMQRYSRMQQAGGY